MPPIKYTLRLRAISDSASGSSAVAARDEKLWLSPFISVAWLNDSDALSTCRRRWKILNLEPYRPAVRVSNSPLDHPAAGLQSKTKSQVQMSSADGRE